MPAALPEDQRKAIIPGQEAPAFDNSDPFYREVLIMLRVQIRSDKAFFESIKVLETVLQNIIKNPGEVKYSKLRLTNDKIKKNIGDVQQARFILEVIGFQY